jgi:hypothetical protein
VPSDPAAGTDREEEGADPTPAYTAWCSLTADEVRQISELARQGRRHPDERVAEIASNWALVLLGDQNKPRRAGWGWLPGHLLLAASLFYDDGWLDWLDRRWARRVLAAR